MIGIIGIGAMGSGVVSTLLGAFKEVTVFDIDEERVNQAVGYGAVAAVSARELVKTCDPVLVSLPKSEILSAVMEKDILPHVKKGQTIIDLGTTITEETRQFCGKMREKGAFLIDAPVSGGPVGSATGSLFIFVGGDKEAAHVQWPLLKLLGGGRLTYCGESGAGQITKAVNQLAMGITSAAMLEAIAFGVNAGVDPAVLLNAVGGSGGFRATFSQTISQIMSGNGNQFDNKYAEFHYFLHESENSGFPMPMLEALYDWCRQFPSSEKDNMGRPFPPYWESLISGKGEEDD
jgi:2-hydroxy-3-oxopropionate reductase